MFFSRNRKNNVYPCKPQFYYVKVGFKGSKLYRYVFVMGGADLPEYVLCTLLYIHLVCHTTSIHFNKASESSF